MSSLSPPAARRHPALRLRPARPQLGPRILHLLHAPHGPGRRGEGDSKFEKRAASVFTFPDAANIKMREKNVSGSKEGEMAGPIGDIWSSADILIISRLLCFLQFVKRG